MVIIHYFETLIKQERTKKQKTKESQSSPKGEAKRNKIIFWRIAGFFWPFFYHIFCVQPPLNP
ncbi:hypothetical protein B0X67_00525 [Helicobacter pylori]|nr:hypothetical protein B0X67_00525 [Helicobacter pylori]